MAKAPADRFSSCREFATALQHQLGPRPVHFHTPPPVQSSHVATASAIGPGVPRVSRSKAWLAALVVIPLLVIAGGIFAGVKLFGHRSQSSVASSTHSTPSATTTANAHSFTGTYRADYGPGTDLQDKPVAGAPAMTANWGVRSTCGAGGCVATASYLGGSGIVLVSNLVFDDVGGNWVAVGLGSTQCNNAPSEVWVVFTLQPQPDGTLSRRNYQVHHQQLQRRKAARNLHAELAIPTSPRFKTRPPCRRGRRPRPQRFTAATTKRSPTRMAILRRDKTIWLSVPSVFALAIGA